MITKLDCLQLGLLVAATLVAGCSLFRRVCAALIVACSFALVRFAPENPFSRGCYALVAVVTFMVTVKLAFFSGQGLSVRNRLFHLLSLDPPKRAGHIASTGSPRVVIHIVLAGLLFSAALLTLLRTRYFTGMAVTTLRLIAGVVFIYTTAQIAFEFAHFCMLAAGVSPNSLHRTPIAARSVREFWGNRWNRVVSAWLGRFVFFPLARRRRPALGLLCAFLVSGAIHGWPMMVALDAPAAFATMAFFVLQAVFILMEDRFHVRTWPVPLARAWTLAVLLASSPLFVNPGLRLFGL